jgi:hypothetical protein
VAITFDEVLQYSVAMAQRAAIAEQKAKELEQQVQALESALSNTKQLIRHQEQAIQRGAFDGMSTHETTQRFDGLRETHLGHHD